MTPPRLYTPADLAAHRRVREERLRRARGVRPRAVVDAERRARGESKRLRRHPVARLLLCIEPSLSDDALRSGIAAAAVRALGWLRGYDRRVA